MRCDTTLKAERLHCALLGFSADTWQQATARPADHPTAALLLLPRSVPCLQLDHRAPHRLHWQGFHRLALAAHAGGRGLRRAEAGSAPQAALPPACLCKRNRTAQAWCMLLPCCPCRPTSHAARSGRAGRCCRGAGGLATTPSAALSWRDSSRAACWTRPAPTPTKKCSERGAGRGRLLAGPLVRCARLRSGLPPTHTCRPASWPPGTGSAGRRC